ncbi:hypothetical protein UABAM_02844 [Candidatus Uabimicrobium amorphum]|uniref:Uncharacterized protein n=1 Tax=Uabimicrobium amorphum TaxID=2596890 RepID=A0A5S9F3T7_UABAM|nr:hypothetical protein UABAM_02844 [Candidatus Uabimicrobium amorphum]
MNGFILFNSRENLIRFLQECNFPEFNVSKIKPLITFKNLSDEKVRIINDLVKIHNAKLKKSQTYSMC